jgi:hypothetical protein
MTGLAQSISALYFNYQPVAGHSQSCSRRDTDLWEVTRHTWTGFDGEIRQTTLRLACRECGQVYFERLDKPGEEQVSFRHANASQVGYGSRPEKVLGLWLHPGPRIWDGDERGPTAYYVTASAAVPRRPEDVIGVVGWHLGSRGAVRWSAGLGCTAHGTVETSAGQDWKTRHAAVKWITAAIAKRTGGAS